MYPYLDALTKDLERDLNFITKKFSARAILLCIGLFTATAALTSISTTAHAVETPTKLYGVITDATEKPLAGVGISIEGPNGFSAET